jgi:hypothetical protein
LYAPDPLGSNQLTGGWLLAGHPSSELDAMTYYEILEVETGASTEEIERAFRTMARKVHPDLNSGDPGRSDARMKQLNEIRDTLTDPLLRAAYDERLRLEELERARRQPPRPGPAAPAEQPPAETATPIWPSPPSPTAAGGFPWTRAALLALGAALVGTTVIVFLSGDRAVFPPPIPTEPTLGERDAAPLLTVPTSAARAPDLAGAPARTWRPRKGRGVVRLGSTADEVLRVFGSPDRIDVGTRVGDAVFVYGDLRLELRNGRVTGGNAALR